MPSRNPPSSEPGLVWPEDESTVIDLDPADVEEEGDHPALLAHDPPPGEFDTPVDVPACHECGTVVVLDDFTDAALHAFPSGQCLRARSGRWWWCAKFRKSVTYVPE